MRVRRADRLDLLHERLGSKLDRGGVGAPQAVDRTGGVPCEGSRVRLVRPCGRGEPPVADLLGGGGGPSERVRIGAGQAGHHRLGEVELGDGHR